MIVIPEKMNQWLFLIFKASVNFSVKVRTMFLIFFGLWLLRVFRGGTSPSRCCVM